MSRPPDQLFGGGYYSRGGALPRGYYGSQDPYVAAASQYQEPTDVEWADYAKTVMMGGASLVQSSGWLANILGAENIGSSIEELGRDAVDFWHDRLSDPAKAEMAKEIVRKNPQTGEYEWGDASFSTVGLMGAQSLLGTAAGMGTGAGLTKVLQVFANPFGRQVLQRAAVAQAARPGLATPGISQAAKKLKLVDTVLGATGFGIGEGAVGGISAGASVYDNVMNLPAETLMQNPRYQEVYNSTDNSISELERHQYAADTVAKEASTAAGWQSGLTTALLGAPMGAYFGRIIGGARLQTTIPRAIGVGAAGEAAQEFAQSGVEQLISNIQTGKYDPSVDLWDDVINAAVSGAAAGGLLGGVVGPAAVKGARYEVAQEEVEQQRERLQTLDKIGGPVKKAVNEAQRAGVDPVALIEITRDFVDQRIDTGRALDAIEQLVIEATTGEQAVAPEPPPPAPTAPETAPEAAEEAQKEPEPEPAPQAVGPEAVPETEKPPIPEQATAPELEMVNPLELQVDAATFQFKAQTDTEGVSKRLKGVKKFDKTKAGVAIVYEDMNGTRFIVDGHQRVALAKRAVEAGQSVEDVQLPAYVFRAKDGYTPEDVTFTAATKNIAEGSGSPVDAAKVLRQGGQEVERELPNLPPTSALVQQAKGLRNLSDDNFAKAVNEVIPQRQAAIVGEMIPEDPALQEAAIEVLRQTGPANDTQARAIVEQVRMTGVEVKQTEDLFGEQALAESLYLERAKVLDAALRIARRDKATFRTLTNRERIIAQTGENVLDTEANLAAMSQAEQAVTMLSTLANQKGVISDALTEAAREVKAGAKPGTVAQGFLQAALAQIETGGAVGGQPRTVAEAAAGRSEEVAPGEPVTTEAPTAETLFSRKAGVEPTGNCFENCGRAMLRGDYDDNTVLVHGMVVGQGPVEGLRFAHAWLERTETIEGPDGQTFETTTAIDLTTDERLDNPLEVPAELYRTIGQAEVIATYTQEEALLQMARHKHWGPWAFEGRTEEIAPRVRGRIGQPEALYSRRERLTNRPLPRAARAELERAVMNPIQTGELSAEEDPGAALLTNAIDLRMRTISLPVENRASMAAIADTLDRVVRDAREFRYREGWRAHYRRVPEFGAGRQNYGEMTSAINSLQNLRDAVRRSLGQAPVEQGVQGDMFGAPAAPEVEAEVEAPPAQEALFSRAGLPLAEVRLMRQFEIEETGEVVEVDQSASVLLRQLDKRIGVVERLRACVRG